MNDNEFYHRLSEIELNLLIFADSKDKARLDRIFEIIAKTKKRILTQVKNKQKNIVGNPDKPTAGQRTNPPILIGMDDEIRNAIALLRDSGYTVTSPSSDDTSLFEEFWQMYGKKVDRKKAMQKWSRLSKKDRMAAIAYLPRYIKSTPDIQYRRNPVTFLNNRSWENDIVSSRHVSANAERADYGKLIKESVCDLSAKRQAKRQRYLRMIEAIRENPNSLMRDVLVGAYQNGLLKELNIAWKP